MIAKDKFKIMLYTEQTGKKISENHETKEHQSKQLLILLFILLDTSHWLEKISLLVYSTNILVVAQCQVTQGSK